MSKKIQNNKHNATKSTILPTSTDESINESIMKQTQPLTRKTARKKHYFSTMITICENTGERKKCQPRSCYIQSIYTEHVPNKVLPKISARTAAYGAPE